MRYLWHEIPIARIAIPFLLGVATGMYIDPGKITFYCFFAGLILWVAGVSALKKQWTKYANRYRVGALLNIGFFIAGITLFLGREQLNTQRLKLPADAHFYDARLIRNPHIGDNSIRLDLELVRTEFKEKSADIKHYPVRVYGYCSLTSNADTLQFGDLVLIRADFHREGRLLNPGEFDYRHYLRNKGIAGTAFVEIISAIRPSERAFSLRQVFAQIQNYGVNVFASSGLDEKELGVASALILGKRSLIDPNLKKDFAGAGAVHILAVSGLHVGIIYLVIAGILGWIFKSRRWKYLKFVLIAFFLVFYAGVTGFSPSVLRATVMFIFVAAGQINQNRSNIYNSLAASAVLLLLIDPTLLREVGFQLSYCAVLGIAYFFDPIYQLVKYKYWFLDKIWALLVVSFTAQLATFPLSIYYFEQFPNYFLLTNIAVIPLASLALYSGLLLVFLHKIPYLSQLLALILKSVIGGLNTIIEWVARLPYSVSEHLYFGFAAVILVYLFIIEVANLLERPSKRNLVASLVILVVIAGIWNYRNIESMINREVAVLHGRNDAVLCFQTGRHAVVFVSDTSAKALDDYRYALKGYFTLSRIRKVDWYLKNEVVELANLRTGAGYYCFENSLYLAGYDPEVFRSLEDNLRLVLIENWEQKDSLLVRKKMPALILSPALSKYQRESLEAMLNRNRVHYWDMQSRGAMLVSEK